MAAIATETKSNSKACQSTKSLTIIAKRSISDVWEGSEYPSEIINWNRFHSEVLLVFPSDKFFGFYFTHTSLNIVLCLFFVWILFCVYSLFEYCSMFILCLNIVLCLFFVSGLSLISMSRLKARILIYS